MDLDIPNLYVRIIGYYDKDFIRGDSALEIMFEKVNDFYSLADEYQTQFGNVPDELLHLPLDLIDFMSNHERRTYQRFNRELQLDSLMEKDDRVYISNLLQDYHIKSEQKLDEAREIYKKIVGDV